MTQTQDLRGENIIDSRDVIARLEELQDARDTAVNSVSEVEDGDKWTTANGTELASCWDEEQEEEYQALKSLADDALGYAPDWTYGEALIADSYFTAYAQDLAEDIGAIKRDLNWPYDCIDWEKAADQLKQDYTSVEFDGTTYWIRG